MMRQLVALLGCLALAQSAQILGLFHHPGQSHFAFFRPLLVGLAAAGHNVTVVSYFPNKVPVANYTDLVLSGMPVIADVVDLKNIDESSGGSIPFRIPTFFMLHSWGMQSCEVALQHPVVRQQLLGGQHKFDVILMEDFANDCMYAVAHLLQAPTIGLSSCAIMPWHYRLGNPFVPAHMPMNFLGHSDEMGFAERLNNFVHFHAVRLLHRFVTQRQTNELVSRHLGAGIPRVEQLAKGSSLMLINQHHSLTLAYPYTPNVIEVGGLQIAAASPLPHDLQQLLDNSAAGVIYISWGSMIRPDTLPEPKRWEIVRTVRRLPQYTFLMRWSNASIPDQPSNLHTRPWLPQRDILCHPHVKAFMSHGGLLGLSEAAYCAVPLVVTPFYGDQFLNAAAVRKRNIGAVVEYGQLTEENLVQALGDILQGRYTDDMRTVSESYRHRPVQPLDLAIWWVEYVIETRGAALLQNSAKHMNDFVYSGFDTYAIVVLGLLLVKFVGAVCFRKIFARNQPKVKKQ